MDNPKPNVTTDHLARCLVRLQNADGPATAAELAGMLALAGCRETRRRHVRAIIKDLRNRGHWIIATLTGGYWLTGDLAIWTDYLDGRAIDAKRIIGEASGRKRIVTADAQGQGLLFKPTCSTGIG